MADESLPHRRIIETVECKFEGMTFHLTLGFYPGDRVGEVQVSGLKHGSNVGLLMEDACALISALLQRFVSPEAMLELTHRKDDGGPASLIGAIALEIVETVAEMTREEPNA